MNKTRQGTESPQKQAAINNSMWLVIIIIAVLVLAVFGYFFGYPLFQKYRNNRFVNLIPEAPPVIQEADTATLTPVVEEIFTEEISSIPKGYYIIAGSFRNKNYADNMVSSNKDIELEALYFEDLGIYRVSAGYFGNIHQAYNKIYGTRDFDRFDDVWVLEYQ
jgi:uncharacterized protein YneF (UPF0154 family)